MKKGIFTLCGFLLFAGTLSAQITLEGNNMGIGNILGSNNTTYTVANPGSTPTLNPLTNATWDFTTLYYDTAFTVKTYYTSPVPNFSYADSVILPFGNQSYVAQNANLSVLQSISTWKQEVDTQALFFTKPSGELDTVEFPTQVATFSYPDYILVFPATYQSGWHSNYNFSTLFNVCDTLLGVKHQAGVRYTMVSEEDTIVGWGKSRVNMPDSITTTTPHQLQKSGYMNVLMMRKIRSQIDTYSVSANTTLYDSLGFSSYYVNSVKVYNLRDTANTYQYLIYRTGTIVPLVTVNYTDASFSTVQSVNVNVDNLSQFNEGVATTTQQYGINIYPNPVINSKVYIDIANTGSGAWSYQLVNMLGQTVSTNNINATGGNIHQELSLPSNLATGIYYMRVNNNGNPVYVQPLEMNK